MSNIRLLASLVKAKLEASTQKPVAAVTYALIKLATDLRSIGFNPVVSDQVSTSESVSFEIIKNLVDSVTALDNATVTGGTTTESYSDNVGLLEAVEIIMAWIREPSDSVVASEQISKVFTKELSDTVSVVDELVNAAINQLVERGDTTGATDQVDLSFTKSVSDSASTSDSRSMDFTKALADLPLVTDQAAIAFIKALEESVSTAETFAYDIYKYFEGADSASVSDASVIDFIKSATDSATATDQRFFEFIKELTESLTAGDSGLLFATDYADISYFAEDYVGISRTF